MTKDRMLNEFLDMYNKEMLESVDDISKEFGLVIHNCTIEVADIKNAKDMFCEFVNDFSKYKMNEGRKEEVGLDKVLRHTKNMVTAEMFNVSKWKYKDLPGYVESYVESIKEVDEFVEGCRTKLFHHNANQEDIGFLSEATEIFYDEMKKRFDDSMNKILTASGYKSRKMLEEKKKSPVFL